MKAFAGDTIEEIKSRCDLVELVSEQIMVKKQGSNYVGLCPFHQEKTPSFTVSPEKQLYHCFGCGASGDLFSFVMQTENMTFPEALRMLADRTGVVLPEEKTGKSKTDKLKEELSNLNESAMRFYNYILCKRPEGKKALQYLENRGVGHSLVETFNIGFAPNSWDSLLNVALKKGYSEETLAGAGLIVKSKDGKKYYDRFRNRIMFPIFDYRKRVIGFGGRIIDEDEWGPKYLNSPATMLFDKSRALYGINFAITEIRRQKKAIVMEGYTDVILAHREGITNAVASLGTALSPMQARTLRAQAEEVIIAYDADSAGEAATERGLDILNNSGCRVKVAVFPEGFDPDSFIRSKGKEAFESILEEARPLTEYRVQNLKEKFNLDRPEEKMLFVKNIIPVISSINNNVEREEYIKHLAEDLDVSEQAFRAEIKKNIKIPRKTEKIGNNLRKNEQTKYIREEEIEPAEKVILSLLFAYEGVFNKVVERVSEKLFSSHFEKIIEACNKITGEGKELRAEKLRVYFDDEALHKLIAEADFNSPWEGFSEDEVLRVVDDCMRRLKLKKLSSDREKIEKRIKETEKAGKQGESVKLLLSEWERLKSEEQELCRSGKKEG